METVQEILQKLTALSSRKASLSLIERDLMLDLTRRLYEVLMSDDRSAQMPAIESPDGFREMNAFGTEAADSIAAPVGIPEDSIISRFVEPVPAEVHTEPQTTLHVSRKEDIPVYPADAHAVLPESVPPAIPVTEQKIPEGISMELPGQLPVSQAGEAIVIPPVDKKEIPESPAMAPAPVRRQELQSLLSINDRFLLLNELFDNSRKKYEAFFNALNRTATVQDAMIYVKTYIEMQQNISEEEIIPVLEEIITKRG